MNDVQANEIQYTPRELLACVAARLIKDGESVFVGTGLPRWGAPRAQDVCSRHDGHLRMRRRGPRAPRAPWSVSRLVDVS